MVMIKKFKRLCEIILHLYKTTNCFLLNAFRNKIDTDNHTIYNTEAKPCSQDEFIPLLGIEMFDNIINIEYGEKELGLHKEPQSCLRANDYKYEMSLNELNNILQFGSAHPEINSAYWNSVHISSNNATHKQYIITSSSRTNIARKHKIQLSHLEVKKALFARIGRARISGINK